MVDNLTSAYAYWHHIAEKNWELLPDLFTRGAVINLFNTHEAFTAQEFTDMCKEREGDIECDVIRYDFPAEPFVDLVVHITEKDTGKEYFCVSFFTFDEKNNWKISRVDEFTGSIGDIPAWRKSERSEKKPDIGLLYDLSPSRK